METHRFINVTERQKTQSMRALLLIHLFCPDNELEKKKSRADSRLHGLQTIHSLLLPLLITIIKIPETHTDRHKHMSYTNQPHYNVTGLHKMCTYAHFTVKIQPHTHTLTIGHRAPPHTRLLTVTSPASLAPCRSRHHPMGG